MRKNSLKVLSLQNRKLIKANFAQMETKEDLVDLLNYANTFLYEKKVRTISLKSFNYFIHPETCPTRYKTFEIAKKSGGKRIIHSPTKQLKCILRSLNFVLQCITQVHPAANGFVKDKSIVTNAQKHVGKQFVYNIDLKNFFHGFDRNTVKLGLMFSDIQLGKQKEELAFTLASLCTHPLEIDGSIKTVLPQGSPTSPTITNILCKRLDKRLSGLARRFGATYTRYADDITFSSDHHIYQQPQDEKLNSKGCYNNFLAELERLIHQEGLTINPKKTRLQKSGFRKDATGLVINEKVNVHRRYIKQIRMWLYYWEKYGYTKASQLFKKDYQADKGHVKDQKTTLRRVLKGKLEFLNMVKGGEDSTYITLNKRFEKLSSKINPIDKVLSVWEKEGIDKAIEVYQSQNNRKYQNKIDTKEYEVIFTLT